MLTVACLYRSGKEYALADVLRLKRMVNGHLPEHRFVCISDKVFEAPGIDRIPLERDLPYWWGKLQLFTLPGPVLCLDLDTVVVGDLAPLAEAVESLGQRVMMLRDFYRAERPASGIMAWSGDVRWIWEEFVDRLDRGHHFEPFCDIIRLRLEGRLYRGDQDLLAELLVDRAITFAQDVMSGIYSYKVHVRGHELPADARIVCFHGKPRPKEVTERWILEAVA